MTKRIVIIVSLLFIIIHLLGALFVPLPMLGDHDFPYRRDIIRDYRPVFLTRLANFDGAHYLIIAKDGYQQYQQAFFPLYPLMIRIIICILPISYFASGYILSWVFWIIGLYLLVQLMRDLFPDKRIEKYILAFLVFPTSFFYISVYPESIFFLLLLAVFLLLLRKKYIYAGIFAYFAGMTKIQGFLLFLPFAFVLWDLLLRQKNSRNMSIIGFIISVFTKNWRVVVGMLSPIAGLATYSLYLYYYYGDPLYYIHAQSAFGANRTSGEIILLPQVLYRYIKIFVTANLSIQYVISLVECLLFLFVFALLLREVIRLLREKSFFSKPIWSGMVIYSVVAIIMPTLTGTLSSIPRYILVSIASFMLFGQLKHIPYWIMVTLFTIIHVSMYILFISGYFVS